ncbi:exodeoxyribonuclease VII small subunit [Candidatus Saccharibacteria bacterium]|nr:exodeoxyribonuclease VII small subunit [Candidatus Saccharibacteria bacterium]
MSEKETINQKIERLNRDIEWFYGEDFELEKASENYKKAIKLTKEIETDLNNLKNEITILSEDFS